MCRRWLVEKDEASVNPDDGIPEEINLSLDVQASQPDFSNPDFSVSTTSPQPGEYLMWRGILPPPHMLAEYNDVVPGGAERLFMLVEREQANRIDNERADRELESAIVMGTENRLNIGQWTASIIAALVVSFSLFLVYDKRYVEAGVVPVGLAVLVKALKQDGRNVNSSSDAD
jgi:hypothetical protein